MVLHQTAWVIVRRIAHTAQHGHLLAPMMRGMCNSANDDPGAGSVHVKKLRIGSPPGVILRSQHFQPLPAVFLVPFHKFQPRLCGRQWRRIDVDSQHIPEPQIFTHTLMHHLFVYAAASRVARAWTHGEIGVAKFTPDAHHFDPFGLIRLNEEFITHGDNPPAQLLHDSHSRKKLRQLSALQVDESVDRNDAEEYLHAYAHRTAGFPPVSIARTSKRIRRPSCRILSELSPRGITRLRRD